ncbi:hypothetical protein TNCV_2130851 [Trichonephila clavipes]|nr:hypothetical protein TNCV_2130851 [Trichonephila clavipes]
MPKVVKWAVALCLGLTAQYLFVASLKPSPHPLRGSLLHEKSMPAEFQVCRPYSSEDIVMRALLLFMRSLVVKVMDSYLACPEFDPSTAGSRVTECQLRSRPRHLTMVQKDEIRRQKPSSS